MKKALSLFILITIPILMLSGCGKKDILDPKDPVTITFWHTYGQQMSRSMGALVDEFNSTVGAELGIVVQTTLIADASEVNEKLLMTAYDDPGAPGFPDIAVIYPRIAVTLTEMGHLMDLRTQFSEGELSGYVPGFLEEGKLGGEIPYLLPIAKSTEIQYINAAIFDRFAADTGFDYSCFETVEGILAAAEKYYEWSGGKAFFYPEGLFNFSMIGFAQLGDSFVSEDGLNLSSPVFQRIWDAYYPLAVKGGTAVFDNYGNYLTATGESVCNLGTSASVTFYPDTVTFSDNTKEELRLALLPYPVFEGGEKIAVQRGGSLCVFKSDSQKEYAAGVFLKWLTAPGQNLRFTAQTGYMPVTVEAFGGFLGEGLENVAEERIIKIYETISYMNENYTFFVPPVFDGYEDMQRNYTVSLRRAAEVSRREYMNIFAGLGRDAAFEDASDGVFERFTGGQ